ncbi:MAG: glycosyltransferase [Acidobacteriota bacterium]
MVRQFIVRGYIVDVVDDRLGACVPDITRYDVIVDEWTNLPRWIEANPAALTLFYATGAHWLTWNQAELQRLSWLRDRTNCEIAPVRLTPALLGSHHANLITSFGNEAINATFGKDTAKIHKLWISAVRTHEPLRNKSWERAKRRFLWFGGPGWVHKGLDLAIEAFLQMEDLELVICGFGPHHDVRNDLDIRECYGDRLDSAPNIVLRGYLDPLGEEFAELANSCVGLVYPTGCEGCSGAAVQCLHMGLLPITTALCGLDAGAEPIIVDGSSDRDLIESIIASCNKMSEWPNNVLEQRRVQAWEFANANHTRSGYRRSWSTAVDSLLGVTSRTHP